MSEKKESKKGRLREREREREREEQREIVKERKSDEYFEFTRLSSLNKSAYHSLRCGTRPYKWGIQ